jgi:hypothetical protein
MPAFKSPAGRVTVAASNDGSKFLDVPQPFILFEEPHIIGVAPSFAVVGVMTAVNVIFDIDVPLEDATVRISDARGCVLAEVAGGLSNRRTVAAALPPLSLAAPYVLAVSFNESDFISFKTPFECRVAPAPSRRAPASAAPLREGQKQQHPPRGPKEVLGEAGTGGGVREEELRARAADVRRAVAEARGGVEAQREAAALKMAAAKRREEKRAKEEEMRAQEMPFKPSVNSHVPDVESQRARFDAALAKRREGKPSTKYRPSPFMSLTIQSQPPHPPHGRRQPRHPLSPARPLRFASPRGRRPRRCAHAMGRPRRPPRRQRRRRCAPPHRRRTARSRNRSALSRPLPRGPSRGASHPPTAPPPPAALRIPSLRWS